MLFEKIAFFRSFAEFKKLQLCKLVAIRMSKLILSISCKAAINKLSYQFDAENIAAHIVVTTILVT